MGDLVLLSIPFLATLVWLTAEVFWLHRRIHLLEMVIVELLEIKDKPL